MKLWHGLSIGGVAVALGAGTFIYSGLYNVSAQEEHLPVVEWALHTTMRQSVEARVDAIETPDLTDAAMIQQGASAYESLCAACHLKPGMDNTVLRQGLNPMPPDLTEPSRTTPEEQFWIIENGIKMTGMPSWGATHDDEELWELVAFLQEMPSLSEPQYAALVRGDRQGIALASHDATSADDGHNHEHGDMSAMADAHGESAPEPATADDGHDHEHGDMTAMTDTHKEQDAEPATADDGHDHEHGDMTAMIDTYQEQDAEPATADDGHDHEHGDMSAMADSHHDSAPAPADDGHDHEHGDMSAMTAQDTTSHDDGHENHDH